MAMAMGLLLRVQTYYSGRRPAAVLVAVVAGGVLIASAALAAARCYRRRRLWLYWNSAFVAAGGTVDRLYIHPIKSCKGMEVRCVVLSCWQHFF